MSPRLPIFKLEAHYQRLLKDCTFFEWAFPWETFQTFEATVLDFMRQYIHETCVLRITVSSNNAPFERKESATSVFFSLRPYIPRSEGISVCTMVFDRLFPQHKHTDLLAESYYLREAERKGYADYIRISQAGFLTECAYANLFLVRKTGQILTPAVEQSGCLPGIMRAHVIDVCRVQGIPLVEDLLPREMLHGIQGAFLTNAVHGVGHIARIDDTVFQPAVIADLMKCLQQSVASAG